MKKPELVFVPAPGIGHLVPTCKFAEKLLNLDKQLCITMIIIRPQAPFDASINAYIQSFSSTITSDRIKFITLAQVEPPPFEEFTKSMENFFSLMISSYKPLVKDSITNNKDSNTRVVGLVIDMFCSSMVDVANELGIPPYIFFTSGAGFLSFVLYLSVWHSQHGREFSLTDSVLDIPAYTQLVPSNVLPSFALNKEGYTAFRNFGVRFKETRGILINTFAELEPHALNSLASDLELPPVYTIGPILDLEGQKGREENNKEEIMKWLEDQPPSSVLFLCFGSMGVFEVPQLQELAIALERSGVRFLWSINVSSIDSECSSKFDELLPEGFLSRTKERGMVCGWAPQVHVLADKATAGFVSHCGWNSIIESLWYGVPIVTWPLYGEQQINAFQMVKDLELAVELKLDYRMGIGGILTAEKIENAIRCIMDSENPVRKRVKEMGDKSREVLMEGGSSFNSVGHFIKTILDG
ncbi:hypothetical protein K7X08_000837 [Anisodus acutangulus]|uniref:Glycosyltransferase n=1 Tax=Anisodus acutangulus TaxID=402998 RepID=A0A9Q1MMJ7_9SOLA|nr:hypothetical protein K7X08_000837 [Anisodus acutangulus]